LTVTIGLTGGIGCGKSAVGAILRELGAEYVDTDHLVHELLGPGGALVDAIVGRFGPEVRAASGGIDRARLGAIVFASPADLRDLEALVHPAVRAEVRRRLAASRAPAFVVDAIKLIESGTYRDLDYLWVVTCDPATQRRRLGESRGMSVADAEARIAAQPPQESRLPLADEVIENDGSLVDLRQKVVAAWERTVGPAASGRPALLP
jgi:dephospho-CoA kinase